MVEQATGWRTSDHRVYDSKLEAEREEALIQLKKLDIFNEATRKAVLKHAEDIMAALSPYVAEYQAVHGNRQTG